MARPREPIDLVAAKNRKHLTKAEYENRKKSEVTAPADNIKPPSFLTRKEKDRFNEIAGQLKDIGIMTNLDCDVLARYIRASTEYEKVTKQLARIKFVPDKKSWSGEEEQLAEQTGKYNYLQKIQARLEKQCNANARELGLTISSRCRLVLPKKEEEKPVNKFMKHAQ
ncbi:MAG: phage terminase small subunit P27 family [Lachnospiraceae bacterium]|nr:phage terminase small subunit P27 family [Lachnospiraceae bacterium]